MTKVNPKLCKSHNGIVASHIIVVDEEVYEDEEEVCTHELVPHVYP
jgi:hypothetical protein